MPRIIPATAGALCLLALAGFAQTPTLSIENATATEGSTGTTNAAFTVKLEGAGAGWVESFDTNVLQPLSTYDPRWVSLFGNVYVSPQTKAAVPDPNSSSSRDDYSLRLSDSPTGSVEIVLDFYWDGRGAVGIEGAVQASPPHRLYEAALWQERIDILYFYGPGQGDYSTVAASRSNSRLVAGFYRTVFVMSRQAGQWSMTAKVQDPANGFAVIEQVSANDGRLGEGTQGIGIYSEGRGGSYVTEMRVTPQ
jgi:hypothetical protein